MQILIEHFNLLLNNAVSTNMQNLYCLQIRRAVGLLTAVRRVGPELSKKIYTMFTSENGDTLLGTEE